jgi:O-antigen/teichoic acid export membrane protein
MSELEQEVQRHSIMLLASSAGITLLGFLATIFYAHWVGAEVLGQYFLFLSYLTILSLFSDLGIGYAMTFRICEGKDPDIYFSAGMILRLGLLVLISLALVLFGNYLIGNFRNTELFWILIFVLGLSTFTSAVSTSLGASNRLGLAASVSFIDNFVRICVQVLAIFLGFKVYGLIGGMAAGLLVELVIDLKYLDYHLTWFDRSHIRKIFSFSSWAFLSTTCTTLFDNANLLIISYFLNLAAVGIFGICWTFSVFALFISTALCNTLFVKVSRWKASGDVHAITIALSRATSYALILAIPMFIGGAILGKDLLYYLYGSSFAIGATALVIIIGARVIQSIYQIYSNFLMATDHVKHQFFGLFAGIVANVILACILVPKIGLSGAAIASVSNVFISTIICRYYLGQVIPIHIEWKIIRDIVISAGIMTLVLVLAELLPMKQNVLTTGAMVALGAGVYFAVLFIVNSQLREDLLRIITIKWIQ